MVYLGQMISLNNRAEKEINRRKTPAWNKYWSLRKIFKGIYANHHKSAIFNSVVLPTLTYGAQTWSLTRKQEEKIQTTQNKMERSILQIQHRNRVETKKIKEKLSHNENAVWTARRRKWDWAGHVSRLGDGRWTYKVTFWQPYRTRNRGRQGIRWRDDFKSFLKNPLFHRIAVDRSEWNRLREAFARRQGQE